MPISKDTAHFRAVIAGKTRAINNGERDAGDPELVDAQRGLAAAKIGDYIEKILDVAPQLTEEQRTRLAELLKPARGEAGIASPPGRQAAVSAKLAELDGDAA